MTEGRAALIWAWKGPGEQDYERIGSIQDGPSRRLLTSGKIVVTPPQPPTGAVAVTIDASDPLIVSNPPLWHETDYVIPAGKTFYLQFISVGAAGDPSEKGARIEIFYDDGTRHILERYYVTGFTIPMAYDDVTEARDGTTMVGDGVHKIVVRREELSKAGEVDAVVRGYVQ